MITTPTSALATASTAPGAWNAFTSFTIAQPTATAAGKRGWPAAPPPRTRPCQRRSGVLPRRAGGLRAAIAAAVAGRRCGLGRHGLRRARRTARHDVADLVRIDGLPLEQRLGHH